MTNPKHTPKPKHIATGASARKLREHLKVSEGLAPGEDLFFLSQCLAFLVHDTEANLISSGIRVPHNRFAVRKLRAALDMIDKVFAQNVDT